MDEEKRKCIKKLKDLFIEESDAEFKKKYGMTRDEFEKLESTEIRY
ncbi:hypothetical protein [Methanococcus voltae]|uniref:Uncharacterized protein n=2 Tax=Methanococcus voltae TaxID=2188 RepID=D7DSN2_METV3|nr:hypothetical protein [Methanococcus voltae]MBP2173080.1 hypothetical protein [Methanococcus voltae]MCS3901742.1 hypothetical protein [Methanococcus voltae]MCS3922028.1 hypothetical protein [Methanococcus voltae PS]